MEMTQKPKEHRVQLHFQKHRTHSWRFQITPPHQSIMEKLEGGARRVLKVQCASQNCNIHLINSGCSFALLGELSLVAGSTCPHTGPPNKLLTDGDRSHRYDIPVHSPPSPINCTGALEMDRETQKSFNMDNDKITMQK